MKVVLEGLYPADPAKIPGGVAAVTFYKAQGLAQDPDVELHVVAPIKEIAEDSVVKEGSITVHRLALAEKRLVPNLLTTIARVKELLRDIQPDVVHGEHVTGTLAGLDLGIPTVHSIHGIIHKEIQFARTVPAKMAVYLESRLARKALGRVGHCIATSNYAAREYAPYTHAKMHYIFNPIEDRFFDLPNNEVPNKVLSASVFNRRKNVLGLVRAFDTVTKSVPDATLYLCGKITQPDYHAEIVDYVKTHGLESNVIFPGFISQEELSQHFSEAAIITLFSREETAPMVVSQAMCAGKAVVASAAGGTPDLVLEGETGFIVGIDDEAALAAKLETVLTDSDLRRSMGARAKQVAYERFKKEVVATKTIEVYKELLNEQ